MDPTSPISLLLPRLDLMKDGAFFDSSLLQKQAKIPKGFIWPKIDRPTTVEELEAPVIDLEAFFHGNEASKSRVMELVASACASHGFFQVTNHGIDPNVAQGALDYVDEFFNLPLNHKLRARRLPGSAWGYAGAYTDRFTSKLPWKETLSFGYDSASSSSSDQQVVDYFTSNVGENLAHMGSVYQKYCDGMKTVSLMIMEMLGMSLGVDRSYYRDFFEDSSSIMRCNYYPPCQEPDLTLGTGPHCDPTSLTILQQDQVGGLEVFTGGEWRSISPVRGTLVVNIGDTFMALSNGMYKSCLHRAVVNSRQARRSLAFFLCPRDDRVVRPPPGLVCGDGESRKYPDFTWAELLQFTQRHYRADMRTLEAFSSWLQPSIYTFVSRDH